MISGLIFFVVMCLQKGQASCPVYGEDLCGPLPDCPGLVTNYNCGICLDKCAIQVNNYCRYIGWHQPRMCDHGLICNSALRREFSPGICKYICHAQYNKTYYRIVKAHHKINFTEAESLCHLINGSKVADIQNQKHYNLLTETIMRLSNQFAQNGPITFWANLNLANKKKFLAKVYLELQCRNCTNVVTKRATASKICDAVFCEYTAGLGDESYVFDYTTVDFWAK